MRQFHIGYVNLALNHVLLVPDKQSLRELGLLPDLVRHVYLSIYALIMTLYRSRVDC